MPDTHEPLPKGSPQHHRHNYLATKPVDVPTHDWRARLARCFNGPKATR